MLKGGKKKKGHKSIPHETVVVVVRENNKVVLDYVCVGIVTVYPSLLSLSLFLTVFARSKYQIRQQLN